jgi:hypothetical protein
MATVAAARTAMAMVVVMVAVLVDGMGEVVMEAQEAAWEERVVTVALAVVTAAVVPAAEAEAGTTG